MVITGAQRLLGGTLFQSMNLWNEPRKVMARQRLLKGALHGTYFR